MMAWHGMAWDDMAGSLCKPCETREVEVWRRRGVSNVNVELGLTR